MQAVRELGLLVSVGSNLESEDLVVLETALSSPEAMHGDSMQHWGDWAIDVPVMSDSSSCRCRKLFFQMFRGKCATLGIWFIIFCVSRALSDPAAVPLSVVGVHQLGNYRI